MRSNALIILLALPRALWAADNEPPQIEHEPCEAFAQGKPFEIVARFSDESPIFDPKVIYRTADQSNWRNVPFVKDREGDNFRARVQTGTGALEYFIEVFDENGNGPARFGSPEVPIRLEPSADPPSCEQTSQAQEPLPLRTSQPEPTKPTPEPQPIEPTPPAPETRDPFETAPPPAAKTGCGADEPPLYCSGWLWGTVGFVTIAGVGGYVIWRYAIYEPGGGVADAVQVTITGSDPRALMQGGR